MRYKLIALTSALIILALCGCNPAKDKVESSVAESLPTLIGPADSYKVHAYGSTFRIMRGRIDGLDITGTNVKLDSGIIVSRLFVKIRGIKADTDTKEIKSVNSTEYSASLSEEVLSRYVAKQYPSIPGLAVELKNKSIGFKAKPGVSVVHIGVQGQADLLVREQRILALNLTKLKVGFIPVPGFARDMLDSKFGTIFDAKDLGFNARIKSTQITPGILTLNGDLELMDIVNKKKEALKGEKT